MPVGFRMSPQSGCGYFPNHAGKSFTSESDIQLLLSLVVQSPIVSFMATWKLLLPRLQFFWYFFIWLHGWLVFAAKVFVAIEWQNGSTLQLDHRTTKLEEGLLRRGGSGNCLKEGWRWQLHIKKRWQLFERVVVFASRVLLYLYYAVVAWLLLELTFGENIWRPMVPWGHLWKIPTKTCFFWELPSLLIAQLNLFAFGKFWIFMSTDRYKRYSRAICYSHPSHVPQPTCYWKLGNLTTPILAPGRSPRNSFRWVLPC